LGIGTTSPDGKLDVAGNVYLANYSGTGENKTILAQNDYGQMAAGIRTGVTFVGSISPLNFALYTGNSERVRIDTSGNVGIGTTSPVVKLTTESGVARTSTAKTETAFFSSTDNDDFRFGLAISHKGGATDADRYASLDSTAYRISTDSFATGGSLVLQELGGNVGIGQSVPKTVLNASASTGAILTLESSDTTLTTNDVIGGINFYANDSSTNGTGAKVNIKAIATSTAGTVTALTFGTSDSASATAVEAMRIDGSGNVGIGTSSPTNFLGGKVTEITNSSTTGTITDNQDLIVKSVNRFSAISVIAKNTAGSQLNFGDPDDREVGGFQYDHTNNYLVTRVNGAERMRIDSSGNLLVGATAAILGKHTIQASQSSGGESVLSVYNQSLVDASPSINAIKNSATTTSSARFVQFYSDGGSQAMGGIVGNGATNVQFASISDEREKENIVKISGSLDKIMKLDVCEFDWLKNGEHIKAGFIAQNVEKVFPEFVVENMSNDEQEERKGITGGMSSGYVAHLTKAIQEQQATIEALTARIAALES
jgi:hypothetical protein